MGVDGEGKKTTPMMEKTGPVLLDILSSGGVGKEFDKQNGVEVKKKEGEAKKKAENKLGLVEKRGSQGKKKGHNKVENKGGDTKTSGSEAKMNGGETEKKAENKLGLVEKRGSQGKKKGH